MEKWAKKLHRIVIKRDLLLKELNELVNEHYTYSTIKHFWVDDNTDLDVKEVYKQLMVAIHEYQAALVKRDQTMFSKFLDCIIHDNSPSPDCQSWCSYQY